MGDGAYDRTAVYAAVHERHPEAMVAAPPRANAAPGGTADTAQRDRHIQTIAELRKTRTGIRFAPCGRLFYKPASPSHGEGRR